MKTLKLRIKDKHSKILEQLASEVNFVWNYVNDLSFKHLKRKGEFLSATILLNIRKVHLGFVGYIVKPFRLLPKN